VSCFQSMTDSKRDFYSTVADHFDTLVNPFDQARRVEVIFHELLPGNLEGMLVLDVGCGTGAIALHAQDRGARVIGSDISHAQLSQAKRKGLDCMAVGDALNLPFPDALFDIVLSSEVIEHTVDPHQAFAEMARTLKPGGRLVLTCPNRIWKWLVDLVVVLTEN